MIVGAGEEDVGVTGDVSVAGQCSADEPFGPDRAREGAERLVGVTVDTVEEFERHRSKLFGLAYRMLGSAEEAEDVVQDAYLRWHPAGAVASPRRGWPRSPPTCA